MKVRLVVVVEIPTRQLKKHCSKKVTKEFSKNEKFHRNRLRALDELKIKVNSQIVTQRSSGLHAGA